MNFKILVFLVILFLMTKNKLEYMTDINVINDIKRLLKIDFDNIINLSNTINKLNEGELQINELNIYGKLNFLPKGSIVMWTQNEIPKGWLMCNGQNGTPDLRNRFIVGVGSNYKLNDTGGADTVVLNVNQIPAHTHNVSCNSKRQKRQGFFGPLVDYIEPNQTDLAGRHDHGVIVRESDGNVRGKTNESILNHQGGDVISSVDGNHQHKCHITINNNGDNQPHENRPPYFSLIYIMKEL
jgi:microcystin-dependent protein